MSKGSAPRPFAVTNEEYANRWDAIFGRDVEKKKVIATTRMFGKPVFDLQPLKEAIATFTSRAAEKLRRQYSAASSIDVFVVTNGAVGKPYVYDP